MAPVGAIGTDQLNVRHTTLAAWQSATGQDMVSKNVDPGLAAINDVRILQNSPAVDAAQFLPAWVTDDYHGEARRGTADVGADEIVVTTFGAACKNLSNQEPMIETRGACALGSLSFWVDVANVPAAAPGFFILGNSNTTWGSFNLPFDLGGGCNLKVPMIVVLFGAANNAGRIETSLPIPKDPALAGGKLYGQYFVVDNSPSSFGVTTTAGLLMQL
jgi:hypothetical protein